MEKIGRLNDERLGDGLTLTLAVRWVTRWTSVKITI